MMMHSLLAMGGGLAGDTQPDPKGQMIQTIAMFAGHDVYWVQNTILNDLSNATMIAIAKSLQPHH